MDTFWTSVFTNSSAKHVEMALLHDGFLGTSEHAFTLQGSDLSSGVYAVRVAGEQFIVSRQAVLLK